MQRLILRAFALIWFAAALFAPTVRAGTEISHDAGLALSPYSETGNRLHLKTVDIRAEVRSGFAQTKLTTVFSNTISSQCQASLDLTVPRDSVVTGYAYWFQGERIQAKLLDNDKAWEIYCTITSHHRDPAIMKQWYDTTYHLQIYPVEPNKDLRVEVRYISPLESDTRGLYYRLPLAAGEDATFLERFTARVVVRGDGGRAVAQPGMQRSAWRADAAFTAERLNWKPDRDWLVRLVPRNARMETQGTAVATDRGRGYFSAVVWTARALRHPNVVVVHPGVRSVHTPGLTRVVPAGRRLLIEGRYTWPGRMRLGIRDARMHRVWATLSLPQRHGALAPKKLWAASEIKRMSGALGHWEHRPELAGAERKEVVRLSLAYGVMSPYTAWLAVPKKEFEFYQHVKAEQAHGPSVQTNTWTARVGDPLIRVDAGPDVVRVTALLPTGEPVPMSLQPHNVWEGRFDMPAETAEGEYRVTVLVERRGGSIRSITLTYRIDRRGPSGLARVTGQGDRAQIAVEAGNDAVAACLLMADGRRIPLERASASEPFHGACAEADLTGGASVVLLDGAHNVTRISVYPR